MDDDVTFSSDSQKILLAKGSTYIMSTSGVLQAILSRQYIPSLLSDDAELTANFGANPAQEFFFRVFTIIEETNCSISAVVTINYRVKMWGLKNLFN